MTQPQVDAAPPTGLANKLLGLFGGTFDPIHYGHLRTALEIKQALALEECRLLPCGDPYHRPITGAHRHQRLAMLELALQGQTDLRLDRREVDRSGPTYSLDSLRQIRQEQSPDWHLLLIIGSDTFQQFHRWHGWQEIPQLCHLLVLERAGHPLTIPAELRTWFDQAHCTDPAKLRQQGQGAVLVKTLTALDISATQIRREVAQGHSIRYLVPSAVRQYIDEHQLYANN